MNLENSEFQNADSRQSAASMNMKRTLVEAQIPNSFGKVPYTTSGPPILTNTGDIRKNDYKNMILEKRFSNSTMCYGHDVTSGTFYHT